MRTIILLAFTTIMSACTTVAVPIERKFPDLPPELNKPCQDLKAIERKDVVSILDVLKTGIENNTRYWECALRLESIQDWHKDQKAIFDEVK